MLSDPQSLTFNAVANSLPAVSRAENASGYSKDDGNVKLSIKHTYAGKRNRRLVRVDFSKIAADPLVSAQNIKYDLAVYLVVDEPITGFTVAERGYIVQGLTKWLNDTSAANTLAFLGGQS